MNKSLNAEDGSDDEDISDVDLADLPEEGQALLVSHNIVILYYLY